MVGVGYLGRFHAQKYATLPGVELTAVVDRDPERAATVAAELGVPACTRTEELPAGVSIASVAVPTRDHFTVARALLEAGVNVLVEKPITATVTEARELITLAARHERVLQVGHLERFNPVVRALAERVDTPLFIEAHRVSPFRLRGADANVVLDLMIHDIDLIAEFVRAPVERIDANGVAVLSHDIDIANARIQFSGGCVANVTASRASLKHERRLRLFQPTAYFSVDLADHRLDIRRKAHTEMYPGVPDIETEQLEFPTGDALRAEIEAFVTSVRDGHPPTVTGTDGLRALTIATEIVAQLQGQPPTRLAASSQPASRERHP